MELTMVKLLLDILQLQPQEAMSLEALLMTPLQFTYQIPSARLSLILLP